VEAVSVRSGLPDSAPQPGHIDDLQAVAGADSFQNFVDVILYSALGEVQLRRDFFIGQALRDQWNQLLLTPSQTQLQFDSGIRQRRPLPRKSAEQAKGKLRRTDRPPLRYGLHTRQNLGCGGILQKITDGPGTHAIQKNLRVIIHVNQDDLDIGKLAQDFRDQGTIGKPGGDGIQNQDIGAGIANTSRYIRNVG
jgi:hypothetical protein